MLVESERGEGEGTVSWASALSIPVFAVGCELFFARQLNGDLSTRWQRHRRSRRLTIKVSWRLNRPVSAVAITHINCWSRIERMRK